MFKKPRALTIQIIGLSLTAIAIALAVHFFPIVPLIVKLQHQIGEMEIWGAILYPLLVACCNLFLLPGGVLAVGSGLFFGLWWGTLLVLVGNVLGAAIAFQISRRLGRGWVEKKVMKHRKWAALDEAVATQGWKIIFFTQLNPLFPSSLLNYLYGIMRIRFWPCLLWIALGQAPGLFLYAYLGTMAQLGIKVVRGKTHPHFMEYAMWIGGLVLTLVVTSLLAKVALKILAEAQQKARETMPSETSSDAMSAAPSETARDAKKERVHF